MPDAYLQMNYVLQLTDKDMRLICLALADKLKSFEDQQAAKRLNIKLLGLQQLRLREQQAKLERALEKANEELPEEKLEIPSCPNN